MPPIDEKSGIPAADEPANKVSDDPIERMIDIAIEAQDGKAPSENKDTETPGGDEAQKGSETTPPADKKDSDGGGGDDKSQQPANKEGKKDQKQAHSPKDLTLADGTVVKGGPERRFYEQRELARQQAATFERQAKDANARAEKAEQELNTLKQTTQSLHGVDPDTLRIGARIVTDLQRDPQGTIQKLLAEVLSQGYTIEGISKGIDTAAITRLIESRLPQQNDEPTEQDILEEAKQIVDQFYSSHPDARPHDALLARMMRDHPGLELQTAYYELKNAFIEKGFDFSRTLDENLGVSSQNNGNQQQQDEKQKAPMPNGRTPDGGEMRPADEVKVAHEDTDMSDIVRAAMRESGMNV